MANPQPPNPQPANLLSAVPPAALGESSGGIVLVQEFLVRFGYLERGVFQEGTLDVETAVALRKYQIRQRLPVSGNFDEETRRVLSTGRCGLPDLKNGLALIAQCIWPSWSLTYGFDTDTADVVGAFDAVRTAIATWAAAVPFAFTEVAANVADVVIGWRPAADPDYSMVGIAVAHADYPLGCSVVPPIMKLPKPVHFDDSENRWCIGQIMNQYDVETVALHELGHILGLLHASSSAPVMWENVFAGSMKRVLTPNDLTRVRALYPAENGWRSCHKCLGLFRTAGPASTCPAGGAHEENGSADHHLARLLMLVSGWQRDWRRCAACTGLFFGGTPGSVCPAGGTHDPTGSADYSLLVAPPAIAGQQPDWRQCRDCQGLFFAGAPGSVCPAGGTHDRTGSANYSLIVR